MINVEFLLRSIHCVVGVMFGFIYLLQLCKIQELIKDKSKNIYTINWLLSVIMMLAMAAYYLYSDSRNTASLKFPIISIFCLAVHSINIFCSVRYINIAFSESKTDEAIVLNEDSLNHFVNRFHLSKRETQVLQLYSKKMHRLKISEQLGISKRTTDKHIENIYKKCKVTSSADLFKLLNSN
jgi:DNA-binding CsgD family transcriptional regulator